MTHSLPRGPSAHFSVCACTRAHGGCVPTSARQAVDVDVKFDGSVQVIVEALASVDIPYAKRIAVPLLLSVTLRKLTGKVREGGRVGGWVGGWVAEEGWVGGGGG